MDEPVIAGRGPNLVLIHGWSTDATIWGAFAENLADDFRIHAIDLPGHGANARSTPIDLDAMVEAVDGALPDDSLICGWSLGSLVALRLAQCHGPRLRGLILLSATPRFCAGDDWPHGTAADALDDFAGDLDRDPAGLLARFRAAMCRGDAMERPLRRRMAALPAPPGDRRALQEGLDILRRTDLRAAVAGIGLPALAVHGGNDQVIPPEAGRWLARHLHRADFQLLPDCGHLPFLSRPEDCAALVRQFARDIRPEP